MIDREQYEKDLAEKQRQHLENVKRQSNINWRPCLHNSCPQCFGTGIKHDGSVCIHHISCPCPKCTPQFF